ncbi:MAG: L,D-transpeptidase [Lachnospiraceae bacterium]|nr:L,D-transpeptidase [Lachnospiraceae bacterium]
MKFFNINKSFVALCLCFSLIISPISSTGNVGGEAEAYETLYEKTGIFNSYGDYTSDTDVIPSSNQSPVSVSSSETDKNVSNELMVSKKATTSTDTNNITYQLTLDPPEITDYVVTSKNSLKLTYTTDLNADGYYVYTVDSSDTLTRIKKVKGCTTNTCEIKKLKYGKTYTFLVRSYHNNNGTITESNLEYNTSVQGILPIQTSFPITLDSNTLSSATTGTSTSNTDYENLINTITVKLKVKSKKKNGYIYYYDANGKMVESSEAFLPENPEYKLDVNSKKCVLTILAKGKNGKFNIPVRSYLCSPGTYTGVGTWNLGIAFRYRVLFYNCYGQWTTNIHGNILFHSSPYDEYQSNDTLDVGEYNKLGTACSHGCVRIQCEAAKWIFDNLDYNNQVKIHYDNKKLPFGKPKLEKLKKWHTWDPTDPTAKKYCKEKNCVHEEKVYLSRID